LIICRDIFSNFGTLLDELGNISQARFERQIGQLREERDIIRSNDALTKEEKEQQLTDLRIKENEFQRDRINAEYRMFAITQTLIYS
jgi:lipase chaperone LimK